MHANPLVDRGAADGGLTVPKQQSEPCIDDFDDTLRTDWPL